LTPPRDPFVILSAAKDPASDFGAAAKQSFDCVARSVATAQDDKQRGRIR
jgi:hypothetical protein